MLSFFAFIIGIALTTVVGYLAVSLTQRTPVLTKAERIAWGLTLGPTLSMLLVFLVHVLGLTKLNLVGFLIPILGLIIVLGLLNWRLKTFSFGPGRDVPTADSHKVYPRWVSIGVIVLCVWTALKLFVGTYDALSVPTYWDDSFNNWNMRGKIFYQTEELRLEIPIGNGMVASAEGVSSYPPSVSLMKTWMAVLRGMWSEAMVNGIHIVWFAGLIGIFFLTLRRHADRTMSAFGTYLLVSLPLLIIQGVNPYADVFVASHILMVASATFGIARSASEKELKSWLLLAALSLGLLIFTKNEATVLYTPILLVSVVWALMNRRKHGIVTGDYLRKIGALALALLALIVLPWIGFKWLNGLTFGNAKSVSGQTFAFNSVVLQAIWFHLSHEPNWLFLPLALPLAMFVAGKKSLKAPYGILAFIVFAAVGAQFALFLFVPSVANEALMQTGLSRGVLHITPVALLLTLLIIEKQKT